MDKVPSVLFFWDYDTQWGADRSRGEGGKKNWGHLEFSNTEKLLELHATYDVPACFAVVGAAALPGERPYHDPRQIRAIHETGHEVASHSFKHEWLPGLGWEPLLETLRMSKDALEQCVGGRVTTFVPPFNQPFDYPGGLSFSLSERREVRGSKRIGFHRLCEALYESGYSFCRSAYRPVHVQVMERILGRQLALPAYPECIAGITCVKLNTPGGFGRNSRAMVERNADKGGYWVLYGHPHSVSDASSLQSIEELELALKMISELREAHKVRCVLPRDITAEDLNND